MTIGIVAFGPNAGAGILAGLHTAETNGRGAIGGFVSLAALTKDGKLLRASIQDGGSQKLFGTDLPTEIAQAQLVGLISSGPNHSPLLTISVAFSAGQYFSWHHKLKS